MATTRFLTNNALTRKRWSKDLYKVVLKDIEFNELIGTGTNSIVQMKTELGKGDGDKITMGIRLPLQGEGIVGRNTVEGNEEKLVFKDFAMTIEELNHAVDTGGRMDEHRVPYNLMQEGKDGLNEWWADKLSDLMFAHLCGDTTFRIAGKTFGQNPSAPDSDHLVLADDVAEASMTSANIMDLGMLDRMKQIARIPRAATGYKLRPIMINGKKYFRVILHDYVFDALRRNTNVGEWGDLLRAAQKLQMENIEIVYNGMIISKSERITRVNGTTSGGVYRNIFLGTQAACIAWGGAGESKGTTMSFVPYEKDAKRYVNIRGGGILGIKKVVFNSQDYGCLVGSSYATPLAA